MVTVAASAGTVANPQVIAVIGAGYVGTPTAVLLAHFGHHVTLAERDDERRTSLIKGVSPLMEEGLEELLVATQATGRLSIVADAASAVAGCHYVFLCVATPTGDDGRADVTAVDAVVHEIRQCLEAGAIVVNKSTVPVGTAERVSRMLERDDVHVVSNPEFLREGSALRDSLAPDRIVVGANDRVAAALVAELFSPTSAPVVVTDARTAELVKYAANAFLAAKLSFVNEMAQLCDALGADVADLVTGVGHDTRVGFSYFSPGPGWGGSCLPKDAAALLAMGQDAGVRLRITSSAVDANAAHIAYIVGRVRELCDGQLRGARVAVLGLTFKANTGDRRDSPAVAVVAALRDAGCVVAAYDPTVSTDDASDDLRGVQVAVSVVDAAKGARTVVVLTEWSEFARIDLTAVGAVMAEKNLLDTRGVVDATTAQRAGFRLVTLGRL
jgi:UDPglucose 6-dehydrogenase